MDKCIAIDWQDIAAISRWPVPLSAVARPAAIRPTLAVVVGGRSLGRGYAEPSTGTVTKAMPLHEADDHSLMAEVADGNERAFRTLAGRHLDWALRLAGRLTGNAADAEDVVQEAMLRVWVNASRWRPDAGFRTWFYRVVVNLALDWRRRKPFRPLSDAGDPVDPAPDPQAALSRGQTDKLVTAAIAELPERQRVAVVLTYHEELSNAEVAALLDVSVGAVEGLLVRARQALRERLVPALKE
jgi:RNA polymerase sigma-70 factor (ECF subfamily)